MNAQALIPSRELTERQDGEEILLGTSTVISKCKATGVMLYAIPNAADEHRLIAEPVKPFGQVSEPMRLWQASTHHEISYVQPEDPGLVGMRSRWIVNAADLGILNQELANDASDVRRLSSWPIDRCFVYIDVSDFSLHRPGQQSLIIRSIISIARSWEYWNMGFGLAAFQGVEAMLCTGDGYVFVFEDSRHAAFFAGYLANLIEARVARHLEPVEFHFRIGVHSGPVFCFWDWGRGGREDPNAPLIRSDTMERNERGDWNFIGEGINGGQRILVAAGKDADDVVFISSQLRSKLIAINDGSHPITPILGCLVNRGRRPDKHGRYWRLYEVNHALLCGQDLPRAAFC